VPLHCTGGRTDACKITISIIPSRSGEHAARKPASAQERTLATTTIVLRAGHRGRVQLIAAHRVHGRHRLQAELIVTDDRERVDQIVARRRISLTGQHTT
jgi:hypothetical protein